MHKENDPHYLKAVDLFEKGYASQKGGDLEGAKTAYRQSIALFPTAEAHTFLGWAYSLEGNYKEAIEECKKAIEVDCELGNPYNDIGAYMIEMGQNEEAIPWLEKAKLAPRYEPRHFPYFNLGQVYADQGMLLLAREEWEKALKINPEYLVAEQALEELNRCLN